MKNILCIGGSGYLGSQVINALSSYQVSNVDFKPHEQARHNFLLSKELPPTQNYQATLRSIKQLDVKFNAILVTAGGWVGGSIKDDDYFEKVKSMNEVNLYPSLLAAHIATKYLQSNGLIVFTGAAAVYK